MKLCVFGAGAIGGYVAGKLALSGAAPALFARGAMLGAVRRDGLTVIDGDRRQTAMLAASDDPAELGVQDVVILATKAHQIAGALPALTPLIGPRTVVVPAINGIPWWYCKGLDGPHRDRDLRSCDPSGAVAEAIPVDQVIGCVVYMATLAPEPGVVETVGPNRLVIGAPGRLDAVRVAEAADLLTGAGLDVEVTADIRAAAWIKLWGNVHSNPISVITEATMEQICDNPGVRLICAEIMQETRDVAAQFGVTFPMSIESRLDEGAGLGAFRTSMLQDFDRRRPIELDAILGVVAEMGRLTGVPTHAVDRLYALVRLRAEVAGCYVPPS